MRSLPTVFAVVLATILSPASAQTGCGTPHLVGVPLVDGAVDSRLSDVHAFAPNDIWAVGLTATTTAQGQRSTESWVLHWDGQRFTRTPTPNPNVPGLPPSCSLYAVGGVAPNDLWAAGTYGTRSPYNGHLGPQIFLLHWDGSSWTQVPEPQPQFSYMASSSGSKIQEIIALAPNDVWFFGWWSGDEYTPAGPLTAHWDGSSVTIRDIAGVPNSNSRWSFVDVDMLTPNDMWAVASMGAGYGMYVGHWTGSSWSILSPPRLPVTYYDLFAVGAVSSNDVWVAGSESPLSPPGIRPYVTHWDGSSWTQHTMAGYAKELIAFASNDVWAFGTTIERWDGTQWNLIADWGTDLAAAQSWSAFALAPCEIWTVGTQWASASGPPVMPFVARVGAANGGAATLRLPCSTPPLRHSLLPLDTPRIGQQLRVQIDDPATIAGVPSPAVTAWMLAFGPAPGAPCGFVIPGVGEVLVDASAVIAPQTVTWQRPGQPAEHTIPIPNQPALRGVRLFAQGAFVAGGNVVLTSGLDFVIGG